MNSQPKPARIAFAHHDHEAIDKHFAHAALGMRVAFAGDGKVRLAANAATSAVNSLLDDVSGTELSASRATI